MACLHPLRAFPTGAVTDKGKPVYFVTSHKFSYATSDDFKKRGLAFTKAYVDDFIEIPCGRCVGCKKDKQRSWAFRCVAEATQHQWCYFLTLTYDDAHNPGVLVKRDLQLFNKRLRKIGPFRFFSCGEFGSETQRPHYHELIFSDLDFFPDREVYAKHGDFSLMNSDILSKVWPFGFAVIGSFTPASALYVAKYCLKPGEKGFILMSRKPGLGDCFFNDNYDGSSSSCCLPSGNGSVLRGGFPRYFKNKKGFVNPYPDFAKVGMVSDLYAAGVTDLEAYRDLVDYLMKNPLVKGG